MAAQHIYITLPDGTRKEVPAGSSVGDALAQVGVATGPEIFAANVNGVPQDLSRPVHAAVGYRRR